MNALNYSEHTQIQFMCKRTYIKLCPVYWSLGSLTMLCDPERSRNFERFGKLAACVDYGGDFERGGDCSFRVLSTHSPKKVTEILSG
jgi:hypothetical protein